MTRTILLPLTILLTMGCSPLQSVHQKALLAPGNCQDYVRSVASQLEHKYIVQGIITNNRWTGPHISALVFTEKGPTVIDNGALMQEDNIFPFSQLPSGQYWIKPVPLVKS